MVILHIAWLDNNKANGVSNVVPEHLENQSYIEEVALLNCSNIKLDIEKTNKSFEIFSPDDISRGDISKLPPPFNNPDIVIFHGIYYYYFIEVTRHLVKNNVPYVIVPHGSLTTYAQKKKYIKKLLGNTLFFNSFIKCSSAIQYLTSQEQQMSTKWGSSSFVCGNGMTISKEPSRVKETDFTNNRGCQFTFIGRLEPYHKGIDILLEACSLISSEMRKRDIKLAIYGPDDNGGEIKVLSLISKYNLNDLVSVHGAVYEEEKKEVLNNTDVFILTSRFEGQPLAVMEALSYGIPALLTPGTNIAEEVSEYKSGWKADFSPESIAKKILEAHDSKDNWSLYSKNAIRLSHENFSWESIAKKSLDNYRMIAGK
ncbi:glycosyltransferase [Priestia endophytica]|uniref:Glycosyltransferase involved in cell wall bisynthesis n=1 Tax=Priestia endophytica DSM 13796 TaxID=1121089 RepID=A0A1I5V8B2_9BACI|nr:glycosyltransferase [Priestia endophytica]KYG35618.1 hypothetical protein AZF06_00035 [Priestia endophytica]SFQ03738.1 Glycosyltransferase involved in cell wall bisynthesis [Priestia endophytica DSM 13796]